MRLEAPGVRIAAVETCDFAALRRWGTEELLLAALPERADDYLDSATARRLIAELGVEHRWLTQVPGQGPPSASALDLARSAVQRLAARRPGALERLDALIFVSTSNPHPCNSQAALLADALGISASCFDLKAGCSGGVLGLAQGALLIRAGCERVLVVMAENLSQLTEPRDIRMLLTVGDGAACVLLERAGGAGFLAMIHGTDPRFAGAMAVREPFPPRSPGARYVYEVCDVIEARQALAERWRTVFRGCLDAAGTAPADLAQCCFHQTHAGQVTALAQELGVPSSRVPCVVREHGNMGTPTFAVALARIFAALRPGDRYLMQAVGGGMSWCAIVAEHA